MTLDTIETLEQRAIELLRMYEPSALQLSPTGYHLAFSGGKDSCVIKELAKRAGVKFQAVYGVTTVDPPELTKFIKTQHPGVIWARQKMGMIEMAATERGLPSRLIRWCCQEFKESGGDGMVKILGVRSAESIARASRWKTVTTWKSSKGGFVVAPILNWSDSEVWEYIRARKIPQCSLYAEGFKRLGCVGCPMAGVGRKFEFARWPQFERAWRSAARRWWKRCAERKAETGRDYYCLQFKDGDAFFDWWMPEKAPINNKQQCDLGLY